MGILRRSSSTILIMILINHFAELTIPDDFMVELGPARDGCDPRTGERGQWVKVQSIHGQSKYIKGQKDQHKDKIQQHFQAWENPSTTYCCSSRCGVEFIRMVNVSALHTSRMLDIDQKSSIALVCALQPQLNCGWHKWKSVTSDR